MTDLHANYLRDLGCLLREQAEAASHRVSESRETAEEAFASGRAMAYYEVVSLMEQQAKAFNLPLAEIGFEGFQSDRLLK